MKIKHLMYSPPLQVFGSFTRLEIKGHMAWKSTDYLINLDYAKSPFVKSIEVQDLAEAKDSD